MKKLGLIGGISWVSTADYYRYINEGVNEALGGLNYAECIIHSFNYADIKKNNDANDWEATFNLLKPAATNLEKSGAEALLLCANTMHLIADRLQQATNIPLIHIASETAKVIRQARVQKAGLLGTRFAMEQRFFRQKLDIAGIDSIIPGEEDRRFIHETIFDELGKGIILDKTRERYREIISKLVDAGAGGIILGCTEIPLLISPADVAVPVFDTTRIHCDAAVKFVLG